MQLKFVCYFRTSYHLVSSGTWSTEVRLCELCAFLNYLMLLHNASLALVAFGYCCLTFIVFPNVYIVNIIVKEAAVVGLDGVLKLWGVFCGGCCLGCFSFCRIPELFWKAWVTNLHDEDDYYYGRCILLYISLVFLL